MHTHARCQRGFVPELCLFRNRAAPHRTSSYRQGPPNLEAIPGALNRPSDRVNSSSLCLPNRDSDGARTFNSPATPGPVRTFRSYNPFNESILVQCMVVTAAGRDRSFWASKLFQRATPRDEAVCLCLWLQIDIISNCSGGTFT